MGRYTTRAQQEAQSAALAAQRLAAMSPEQRAEKDALDALVARGGNEWKSDDENSHRIYFNSVRISESVEITCYYDVKKKTWHEQRGTLMSDDVKTAVLAAIQI